MRKALIALCSIAALLTIAPRAHASEPWGRPLDKSTLLTFSAPVSLPGVSLPAGTYMFRLVNPKTSQGVLQVLSQDEKAVYAMLLTMPVVRFTEDKNAEIVTFKEALEGTPAKIGTWYFTDSDGCEMIYPEEK